MHTTFSHLRIVISSKVQKPIIFIPGVLIIVAIVGLVFWSNSTDHTSRNASASETLTSSVKKIAPVQTGSTSATENSKTTPSTSTPASVPTGKTVSSGPRSVSKSSTPAATASPKRRTGVVYGTPELTYSTYIKTDPKIADTCNYTITANISVDDWKGYNSGEVVVKMILTSYANGSYPYTASLTLTPGESTTVSHSFSVPTNPNGSLISATTNVETVNNSMGDAMVIPIPPNGGATSFLPGNSNDCF